MRDPRPLPEATPATAAALVAEAARRSRVCWVDAGSGPRLAWHAWYDEAVVVVSGGGEQELVGLADGAVVEVVMRSKDARTRLVGWAGTVEAVPPEDPRWEGHVAALLGVRLNLVDPAATAGRWRAEAVVHRIAPVADH